jgi:hypothetical protein
MAIRFLCPNGHKIQCDESQAGKAAKCPSCGMKFRIPDLDELKTDRQATASDDSEPAAAETVAGSTVASAVASSDQTVAQDEQIEFLCPNGHRLHGPIDLQGKPGQCPECQARFRIPSYDEVPEEDDEDVEQDLGVGRAPADPTAEDDDTEVTLQEPADEPWNATSSAGLGTLAELFPRLWAMRGDGATVELHLNDGQTLKPEAYAPELSHGSHGVFSLGTLDGSPTLAAVAWDCVVRVLVRDVQRLPEEMQNQP